MKIKRIENWISSYWSSGNLQFIRDVMFQGTLHNFNVLSSCRDSQIANVIGRFKILYKTYKLMSILIKEVLKQENWDVKLEIFFVC